MRRALRLASRAALVLLVLAGAVLAGVYGFSRTDRFRAMVRDEIVARGSEAIRGEIDLGGVEGSIWSEIVLRDVVLRDDREVVLRVPVARLRYDLVAVVFGRLDIEAIEIERPSLLLREDGEGTWNLLRAAAPATAAPETAESEEAAGFPIAIALESLRIEALQATLEPRGQPALRLRDVRLEASADVGTRGLTATIGALRGEIEIPDRPTLRLAARADYDGVASPPVVRLDDVTLATALSSLALSGTVRDPERPETDLRLVARPLAAADLNALVPGLGLRPDVTGEITLRGPMNDLRAAAELAAGEATLSGAVSADVTRDASPWQARLVVARADLAALLERDDARGRIGVRLEARGQGTAFESLGGEASLKAKELAWADWRPGDVVLDVRVLDRRATIDGRVEPGRGSARLTGEIDLTGKEEFDLRLVTEHLAPLRTPRGEPSGDLNVDARAQGTGFSPAKLEARAEATVKPSTLGDISLGGATLAASASGGVAEGGLEVVRLQSGETRFDVARATFDARGLESELPEVEVDLVVERLVAGVELRRLEVATKTRVGETIDSAIGLRAVDREQRAHRADATVVADGERLRLELARLDLDLPGGAWRLAEPAAIERRGDDVTIDRLVARSGPRRVSVAGRVSTTGRQDLLVEIEGVDLESFAALVPPEVPLAGRVSSEVRLGGSAAAPRLDAKLEARSLRASAVRVEALDATLAYVGREATLRLDLRQDAAHTLEARARVPLEVAWAPAWVLKPARTENLPIDVQVRSEGLDLGFLEAFGGDSFENVRGVLALDVSIGGTAARPDPRGTVTLRGGAVDLAALGVKVRELTGAAALGPDAIRLERLSARAAEGRIEAAGRVGLRELAPGAVEATVTLERWPAIRTARYQATIGGEITAGGTFDDPDVRGRVEVLSATLRPDFGFLADRPPARDETIVLVGAGAPKPDAAEAEGGPEVAGTVNRFERLALDVAVEVKRDVWVKQEGTAIELSGDLAVRKARGGEVQVVGRIVTRRGWARFQGKRFRLVEGEIRFTGGKKIDPSLDVVARHRVGGYAVDVVVRGTASSPELELRSDPPLEQADVLSVLLFGKRTSELSEGERSSLGDQAAALATSFAVSEVSRTVTEALGIESLGIQVEEVSADRAAVGAYVTERTYVSVAQDFSGDEGREVSVEYEILPPNWSVLTSTKTTGESGGDVIWKKRY